MFLAVRSSAGGVDSEVLCREEERNQRGESSAAENGEEGE